MITILPKKVLTLGEFVMGVFDMCEEHKAAMIVWLAAQAGLLVVPASQMKIQIS